MSEVLNWERKRRPVAGSLVIGVPGHAERHALGAGACCGAQPRAEAVRREDPDSGGQPGAQRLDDRGAAVRRVRAKEHAGCVRAPDFANQRAVDWGGQADAELVRLGNAPGCGSVGGRRCRKRFMSCIASHPTALAAQTATLASGNLCALCTLLKFRGIVSGSVEGQRKRRGTKDRHRASGLSNHLKVCDHGRVVSTRWWSPTRSTRPGCMR